MLLSVNVVLISKTVTADEPVFHDDFETGSSGWTYVDGSLSFAGTQQSVVYEGASSYKMTGTIDSNGAFAGNYQRGLYIPVVPRTEFTFAYMFPSKKVSYVGYILTFNNGKIGYYISLFNGNFVNISSVYLLQYAGESVNAWHAHTVDVYGNYQQAFGSVPQGLHVTAVTMMMGDPYYTHKTQTAYFDDIRILIQGNCPPASEFTEDFETGSDGWSYFDGSLSTAGTQQSVVYEGTSAYKMTGTIDSNGAYAGNYRQGLHIPVTPDTQFSFAYDFPSKKVAYIGYYLVFNTGKLGYYISKFSGSFVNLSTVYLLQYISESVNAWHAHSANVYENYLQAFGSIPEGLYITGISMMMGDPYYTHKTQTAYFDGISITTEQATPPASEFTEDFETGSDGWIYNDGSLSYAGTQQSIVYEGASAYKMKGTIDSDGDYAGNYQYALNIPVTSGLKFNFAYEFPSKKVSYVGYILMFSTGKIGYYISLFNGNFVNISSVYLLQYKYETLNSWHAHTADIYANYQQAFGGIPEGLCITSISMMMGDPYYTHKTQTAYFDGISIKESGSSEDFENGYDGWQQIAGDFRYAGTQTQVVQQGSYAFKMAATRVGESGYAGQYSHPVDIIVTPETVFTFSYYFPSKSVSYVGYYLTFNNGKQGYYFSLFSGWFVNNTNYYLCQYSNEQSNTWHTHWSNVYDDYQNAYGTVPSNLTVTSISMIMGDPYFTNQPQTAYFDSITLGVFQ